MTNLKNLWLLFVLLLAVGYTNAQQQVCTLRTYYSIPSEAYNGSWSFIGAFDVPLKEDGETTKDFHHAESGIDIHVRVDIDINKHNSFKEPDRIELAMSFSPDYEARAESIYDKHWKWLSVKNDIKVGNRNYTFGFSCTKMNKKEAALYSKFETMRRQLTDANSIP